jgi:RNA polymerase sigma factor (sigma-70 family)
MTDRSPVDPTPEAGPIAVSVGSRPYAGDIVLDSYRAHGAALYAFLVQATRDPDAAADLLQEAYLRLLREVRAGRAPGDARAWLYRVAGNLAISRGRRRRSAERWLPWLVRHETVDSPEADLVFREDQRRVLAQLTDLPADGRVAVLMAAHGFSGPEIAAALGRSELAARSLLFRTRSALRDRLERTEMDR